MPKFDTCFFERYAQITLCDLFGERYAGLVNLDRPDLQDINKGIGIEVTRAMEENKKAAQALLSEMAGNDLHGVNSETYKDIQNSGYAYGLHTGNWLGEKEYSYWQLALPLKRIIANKVRKVASGFYGEFETFGLYIFSKDDVSEGQVRATIAFMRQLQKQYATRYSILFLSEIQTLYACDLRSGHYSTHPINPAMRKNYYNRALQAEF